MKSTVFLLFLLLTSIISKAQNFYEKLGQKSLVDGDFKMAVLNLEKAIAVDSNNVNTLYMLGYSYYHSANYKKAVSTFARVLSLKPNETSAYYYRGKAKNILATETQNLSNSERERFLLAAIRDFSKAINLNSDDIKLYQNRAIAYRDYGVLKAQKIPKLYDKLKSTEAFRMCIIDFQKVLDLNPGRKDIVAHLENARAYLQDIK